MRAFAITIGTVAVLAVGGIVVAQVGRTGGPAAQAALAPKDRASYFPNTDLQSTWKDLEARKVINKRVLDEGKYSINVRIVRESDAPLVHAQSIDIWVTTAGTATAVTGGQIVEPQKRPNSDDVAGSSIRNGVEQPLQAGDVLYVPAGVPHGFKNVKGFRALLLRFDTK